MFLHDSDASQLADELFDLQEVGHQLHMASAFDGYFIELEFIK